MTFATLIPNIVKEHRRVWALVGDAADVQYPHEEIGPPEPVTDFAGGAAAASYVELDIEFEEGEQITFGTIEVNGIISLGCWAQRSLGDKTTKRLATVLEAVQNSLKQMSLASLEVLWRAVDPGEIVVNGHFAGYEIEVEFNFEWDGVFT